MRNLKRTLALVLAVFMMVGTFATVSAAPSSSWTKEAVDYLDGIGVSNIGKDMDAKLSRNEFVLWVAKIESHQLSDKAWDETIASVNFSDVTDAHHKAAIAYSYKARYIIGNGDGTFAPDKTVSLAEASAVIVRLMGFESKVTGLAEEWDMNYMRVANTYCNAFDQKFYDHTDTWNPDYELTKGEGAWLLATIMNGVNTHAGITQVTADGIDLGEYFRANVNPTTSANSYYVLALPRVSKGLTTKVRPYIKGSAVEMYTNAFDTTANVVLRADKGGAVINVPGEVFVQAVRVSLGLGPVRDYMNEEPEINIYNTVNVGTVVNFVLDDPTAPVTNYKQLKNFSVSANSVVVDTVLQTKNGPAEFLGYGVASLQEAGKARDLRPTLPVSYSEDKVVTWTNVLRNTAGEVTSAVLNFMGKSYAYGADITAYDTTWTALTVDEAVNKIINAAQGEAYIVFNDVDGDGRFDNVVVKESYPFAYAAAPNVKGGDATVRDYMTSISGGKVAGQAPNKGNSIGSVIWNKDVVYPNNNYNSPCTDPYDFKDANPNTKANDPLIHPGYGKLQLVLAASNVHPAQDAGDYDGHSGVIPFYTVVDLAAFYTGIIEEVDAWTNAGYWTAKVKTTDGAYVTILIPKESVATATIPVTIGGATAEYTFDSSAWGTFMTKTKDAALQSGIAVPGNVENSDVWIDANGNEVPHVLPNRADFATDEAYNAAVEAYNAQTNRYTEFAAAWMAGKFVEFATNKDNVVICINGTEKAEGTTGFVTAVEKSETGDNTYNVTVAADALSAKFAVTPYFSYHKDVNAACFRGGPTYDYYKGWHVGSGTHCTGKDRANFITENGVYGVDDGTGHIKRDAEGYALDDNGNRFIYTQIVEQQIHGISGFETFEVRASASGMFDFDNYMLYNSLFNGNLLDPNHSGNGKVDPEKDLVYVKVMQDAGTLNYVLYDAARAPFTNQIKLGNSGGKLYNNFISVNGKNQRWAYVDNSAAISDDFWNQVEGEYIINLEEVPGSKVESTRPNGVKYFTAKYNATVGFDPYYYRTWDASAKKYTYEIGFTTVKVMENVTGEADAIVDTTKTLMIPVFQGATGETSVQVQVKSDAERASYVARGYFVDDSGYVFSMIAGTTSIEYKKDASGNILYTPVNYNWAAATVLETRNDVLFTDSAKLGLPAGKTVGLYATATIIDKPKTDEGWFPGSYYLVIDGIKFNVTVATNIALITPSANGFAVSTKTVGDLVNAGTTKFFVTEWVSAVAESNVVENIAFIGTDKFVVDSGDTPSTPVTDKNRVVYLDKGAQAIVRQNETSKEWMVISNKSAYVLPTGEDIGAIYRTYPTYAQAISSLNIDLSIEGGKWYVVDANGKIVSASNAYVTDGKLNTLKGTITDVKYDGTTIATMNGKKNVDITNMKTEYYYFDGTGSTLYKAGDSKNVQPISSQAYADLFKDLDKAVTEAQNAYNTAKGKFDNGMLSKERLAYYEDNLAKAKTALVEAKASSLDQYFNGQFWGFENCPVYRDFVISQGSFQKSSTLTFDYIVIGDTLCVFSDSFVLG